MVGWAFSCLPVVWAIFYGWISNYTVHAILPLMLEYTALTAVYIDACSLENSTLGQGTY